MGYYRRNRYRNRAYRRGPLRGFASLIFIVFLFFAFLSGGHFFLPLLFVGLAFAALFGSVSTLNPRGLYGGIQGFIWMLGLALCFAIGFWPWILLPIIVSAFLGVLIRPIMAVLLGLGIFGAINMMNQAQQQPPYPYYQPSQPQQPQEQPPVDYQQPYESYQQGYQPTPQPSPYQGGQPQYYYPQNEPAQQQQYGQGQSYEQPQAQYPQEMPPPQQ